MVMIRNKISIDSVLLILLLCIGTLLRLWKINEMPITHDEFSALFRTQFNSFRDLIDYGIKVDGHPPLIQVLLYYYTKLVGFNALLLKLPFIIAGIASIYLLYKTGSVWFARTSKSFN